MIAHLGMYDTDFLRTHTDQYWEAIRTELGFGPSALDRDLDFWDIWRSPGLLLSQTCGYPYRAKLHGQVHLVGTPNYDLPECPVGHYYSVIVARSDHGRGGLRDFDGARFAYNEALSQSGWAAPIHHMRGIGMSLGALIQTGGHAHSARAVLEGRADFAGLDVLTYLFLCDAEPEFGEGLCVLEKTAPTPTLPYITSLSQDAYALAGAVARAIDGLPIETKTALRLKGLTQIPSEVYLSVPTPPSPDEILSPSYN